MTTVTKYFDLPTLAKIRPLGLRAKYLVEGLVSGLHRSPFQGHSIEFSQHREYAAGDDLRQVDWKVFGRTDKYYLKQYEDETDLLCQIALDTSESMDFKGEASPLSKLEYAQLAAVAIGHLVLAQQDAVGLLTFNDTVNRQIPASGNPRQLQDMISLLESALPAGQTQIEPALKDVARRLRRRGILFVISDFFNDAQSVLLGLKHLRYVRHDVVVLQVMDAEEIDFPIDRPTQFLGLESMGDVVVDPVALRQAYIREVNRHCDMISSGCRQLGIDYHLIRTDLPLSQTLPIVLAHRRQRRG